MTTRLEVPGGHIPVDVTGDPNGARATLVLGNGAGASLDSDFMSFFAQRLGGSGMAVVRFDFLYQDAGRKVPDKQPVLERTYAALVDHLSSNLEMKRLVIGGKSMGGRIASHVAIEHHVDGLVLLGYPLHPPGRPDRMRDAHLK
ncbi:MAG: alpha/beta family hydrolase, partial [Actinomycetota bacterium]